MSKEVQSHGAQITDPSKLTYNASMVVQEYPRSNSGTHERQAVNELLQQQSGEFRIKSQAESAERSNFQGMAGFNNNENNYEAVRYSVETSENQNSTPNMFLYGPRGS